MLINEVAKITGLTKKAIVYYTEKELVSPKVLENGYRDYSQEDVKILRDIYVYRKLNLQVEEIREILKHGKKKLDEISIKKDLELKNQSIRAELLHKLSNGSRFEEIEELLNILEKNSYISEMLIEKFPGHYGRYLYLHFSKFLEIKVVTEEQKRAYEKVMEFLDNMPNFTVSDKLNKFLENTPNMEILQRAENETIKSIEEPENFLDNREQIEAYLEYRKSDEYKSSIGYELMESFKSFNQENGFYDVFIPNMRVLSKKYDEFYKKLEIANELFIKEYGMLD
ncbi:MerR family transcriptional regulator [Peptoniphilus indolicus]|uniref:HTH merR-type domain-containing protein n=2 Tax=Peptoniphilus indolicus TaxID=33030 RepID=G4D1I7_9FIRM|nr:MerR family transcriptional regulator [Peptoniphilus indolicus]EGY80636.1 hypothetical protein HMPREF9129_0267 [Peptoniphilus indolicus ATCC 29427]SUB74958.1 Copper export regulator [Peptoniphilus indolicus]